ncbi:MAG: DNA translocase FtsK [Sphaerochaetaceae bacterium]|nr:DNA translocase FtsK [Spirochaetales bacterium]MDY5499515.1 DNA translocase FtsK [Sphaerochaetaceae bacterium]
MATHMKKKGGRRRITSVWGIAGFALTAGAGALAYGKASGKVLPDTASRILQEIDSRFGVVLLGKASLVPLACLFFLLSLGFFTLRKRHFFTLFLYPFYIAIYLTANFLAGMAAAPSHVWPEHLYAMLLEGTSKPVMAFLVVILVLLAEVLATLLFSLIVSPLNARHVRKAEFLQRKEEHDRELQADEATKEQSTVGKEQSKKEAKEARIAAKRQAKQEKREAKRAARAARKAGKAKAQEPQPAAVAPVQEPENEVTVTVPVQQDDGHLRFPKVMEVPTIDNLLKREEQKQQPAPAKGTWNIPQNQQPQTQPSQSQQVQPAGPTMLDLAKEKVQHDYPITGGAGVSGQGPNASDGGKKQVSGLLQGAMERVGWHKKEKAKPASSMLPGQGKGLLCEAVEENLRKNKEIANMGSSFSKVVPDKESEVMRPVEEQEAALRGKSKLATQAAKEDSLSSVFAAPDEKPQPTRIMTSPIPKTVETQNKLADAPQSFSTQTVTGPRSMASIPVPKDLQSQPVAPSFDSSAPKNTVKPESVALPSASRAEKPMANPLLPHATEKEPVADDDMLDDLQSICGVGGLASANAGKSALLNRKQLDYQAPPIDILVDYPAASQEVDELTRQKGDRLIQTLDEFGVSVTPVSIIKGPTVTMYEIAPAPGVRVNRILGLADNIQLSLPATQVRIVAPIPGKSCVGVEVPNAIRTTVGFKEMLPALDLKDYKLPMILGRNLLGEPVCCDVSKTPHLLIAGATGSGKSVCVNSLICSILYKKSPREVRMVMVDPKVVELQMYNGIPHLLTPVITDSKKTLKILDFCLDEMDRRYRLLEGLRTRSIIGYNEKIAQGGIAREKMPYIIVIIDEFADLMNTVGKELEQKVSRLAAMSRAVGIHLVLATQRPSVDVVTGIIKSNLPGRIAFMVNSAVDSRIILEQTGAEKLLGKGDMLYLNPADPTPQRIQGAFLSDSECEKIVDFVSAQGEPDYIDEAFLEDEPDRDANIEGFDEDMQSGADEEDLYQQALAIVVERKSASASFLQRRLRIGYNHAARLVEQMEEEGVVGPANGSKPRPLLRYPGSPSLQQLDAGAAPTADDIGQ